jgi:hypothetical protein
VAAPQPSPHRPARARLRASRAARWIAPAIVLGLVAPAGLAGSVQVSVGLPVPARINTRAIHTILVARFLSPEHATVDVGTEFVRYVRRELGKGTKFRVLDVEPPALPEQSVEDLLKNAVFWKHIAEEYGADLVVSGRAVFTTADRSAFVQEDVISPVTGQKVRRTRFAEREEYGLEANIWFFKGANGAFLYEDTFRNKQVYEGKSNDALQIFFNLADRLTPDLLGVVAQQKRQESRYIFDE